MKIKTSIILATTVSLLTLSAIYAFAIPPIRVEGNKRFLKAEIPVVIKPLNPDILNVNCERIFVSRSDTLTTFSCTLVNQGNLPIHAVGANYSLVTEVNGVEQTDTHLFVADAFVHSDFSREIVPGQTLNISPSGPISIPNAIIKKFELEIIYVQFGDGSSLGESEKTVKKIAGIRYGALMFKAWIKNEFLNRGRSEEALLPLLDNKSEFGPKGNKNFDNEVGAKYYKKFLRERFDKNGRGAIQEILDL
ncbi:MAG TPA: hypothetical protein DEA22_04825 [Blastocatellia bacterium]|nr:hypothetical protein [Blastocatellia bacterium]